MTIIPTPQQAADGHPRTLGQVFTPRPIADWMARWACRDRPRTLLDPALGGGVFVEAALAIEAARRTRIPMRIDACEVDAGLAEAFGSSPASLRVHLRREDFILASFDRRYDAILANPPYVRHHSLDYDEPTLAKFDRMCGRRLSRSTNLYGLFLVKIWSLLAEGGRAAVITPAEWLNADFGGAIKAHLLAENAMDAILQFDHATNVFDDVLTTAAITLLRRGRRADEPIHLFSVGEIDGLPGLELGGGRLMSGRSLDPATKWAPLFSGPGAPSWCGPVLGDVAACMRGIATGANGFFALRPSDLRRRGLAREDVRPCITKARQIRGDRFTAQDLCALAREDQRMYLLRPRHPLHPAVERYLAEGTRAGIDRRYLPAHRPLWYMPEERPAAPILVSVFARGAFRFVRNEAEALNLTAYHGIYPREACPAKIDALFDYLRSESAQKALAAHRRIYADGLLKLEPRDVEAVPIPDELAGPSA